MKYVFVAFLALISMASTSVAAEPAGQQWAVLISVAKHDDPKIQSLSFTVRDAQALRRTLTERAGIPSDHILEMTDDADKEHKPTLANLRRELKPFLGRVGDLKDVALEPSGGKTGDGGIDHLERQQEVTDQHQLARPRQGLEGGQAVRPGFAADHLDNS